MKFTRTAIPDVLLIEPKVFEDPRGFFFESYSEPLFARQGITVRFVQDNHSRSAQGVLRGLHYQAEPKAQAKLVRTVRGRVFDVTVDLRKGSATFGRYVTAELSAENKYMIYIPPGFAHGFCVLEEGTEFFYKTSEVYSPEHERGILWNDPEIGIPWPKVKGGYLLSDKDRKLPTLKQAFH